MLHPSPQCVDLLLQLLDNVSEWVIHEFEAFKLPAIGVRTWYDRGKFADGIPDTSEPVKLILSEIQF